MYCPNCNRPRPDYLIQCPQCGAQLLNATPQKKGRLWPAITILAVMAIVGIVLVLLTTPKTSTEPDKTPWFSVSNGTLYFDARYCPDMTTLTVPTSLNGQTVTRLSDGCFRNCDKFVTVTLPSTLTFIGDEAFANCSKLRVIKLPERVHTIGENAFANCVAMEAMYVPASVETIGTHAFQGCNKLTSVFFVGDSMDWHQLYSEEICETTQIYMVSGPDAEEFSPG